MIIIVTVLVVIIMIILMMIVMIILVNNCGRRDPRPAVSEMCEKDDNDDNTCELSCSRKYYHYHTCDNCVIIIV